MSEGNLVKWHKKEGDVIKAGQVLAEIETDKATMEMESSDAGTLAAILVREGELEFQHVGANGIVSEHVGPGGVFYVAYGTKHTVKNVGGLPASYFVVAIGGDAG